MHPGVVFTNYYAALCIQEWYSPTIMLQYASRSGIHQILCCIMHPGVVFTNYYSAFCIQEGYSPTNMHRLNSQSGRIWISPIQIRFCGGLDWIVLAAGFLLAWRSQASRVDERLLLVIQWHEFDPGPVLHNWCLPTWFLQYYLSPHTQEPGHCPLFSFTQPRTYSSCGSSW